MSSACVRRLCPGRVRGENASKYKHEKLQCLCILPSFSSCIFLLAITPPYTTSGEVNDSAVKAESRLFDLDSKPAFLNKYSEAEERWHVALMLQITGYVWGKCLSFGPSTTMVCRGELTGSDALRSNDPFIHGLNCWSSANQSRYKYKLNFAYFHATCNHSSDTI